MMNFFFCFSLLLYFIQFNFIIFVLTLELSMLFIQINFQKKFDCVEINYFHETHQTLIYCLIQYLSFLINYLSSIILKLIFFKDYSSHVFRLYAFSACLIIFDCLYIIMD
jgi:hypothetical protein